MSTALTSRGVDDPTFWLYAGICFAGFVFVLFSVPETMGKTLKIESPDVKPVAV